MIRLLFAIAMFGVMSSQAGAQGAVHGPGRAKDGDSLTVGSTEVRLFGIDAPELAQSCTRGGANWSCGEAAANRLSELVTGRTIVCSSAGQDDHKRVLGRCMVGATDINRSMVASGLAVAFRRYSTEYVSAEESARANKRGIWAGTFRMPSEFRKSGDLPAPAANRASPRPGVSRAVSGNWQARASGNCRIKGNRNRKGQWIYHMPGMPYYDQTRPEEIFCTEAEAQAAGYRRAIVR